MTERKREDEEKLQSSEQDQKDNQDRPPKQVQREQGRTFAQRGIEKRG